MMNRTELREYVKDNPDEPVDETVSKFGVSKQHVYNARHDAGVSKPITMSKMKRLKVVRKSTIEDKDARIAELEKQVEMLKTSPNEKITSHVDNKTVIDLINRARKFETELLDAKAIIAYLERKLNGTSV